MLLFLNSFFSKFICTGNNRVPMPKEIKKLEDNLFISGEDISLKISIKDSSNLYIPINDLAETFKTFKGWDINSNKKSSKIIWIGIPDNDNNFETLCRQNGIVPTDEIGDEGYALLINKDLIIISANKNAGIFYGIQTLKQLIRGNSNSPSLPGLKIIDWPSLKYRGILDDISRDLCRRWNI